MWERGALNRFKHLSRDQRRDCSTWLPEQWHQGHGIMMTSLCSDLLLHHAHFSPFPPAPSLFLSPVFRKLLNTLEPHMAIYRVLSESSQGSTLLDLMQQIKLWHLLVLLNKTAQSAFARKSASLNHQLLNSSFFAPNQTIGHLSLKFKLYLPLQHNLQICPRISSSHTPISTLHLSCHCSLIWDMSCSSLKPL